MNQFYEHKTADDHRGDLLAVRLASINQILDPWVYILCKKVMSSKKVNNLYYKEKWCYICALYSSLYTAMLSERMHLLELHRAQDKLGFLQAQPKSEGIYGHFITTVSLGTLPSTSSLEFASLLFKVIVY